MASLDFLTSGEYADAPPTLTLGQGCPTTRFLAGRLKVRWPGGQHPHSVPAVLKVRASEDIINFERLLERASGSGATALLTRAATLLFVSAFREHPQCRAAFQEFDLHDPVSRAQQYIETHPFNRWSVEMLACKVGMGRSNFATRFSREIGFTPMEFMSEERMKHAALFLEKTDMKVAEIGARVGYRSEAAFIRRFTARFGITPGALRKRSRSSARSARHQTSRVDQPPSTGRITPVTNEARSDTRNTATSASSCGVPARPSADFDPISRANGVSSPMNSVNVKPGAMALARMP